MWSRQPKKQLNTNWKAHSCNGTYGLQVCFSHPPPKLSPDTIILALSGKMYRAGMRMMVCNLRELCCSCSCLTVLPNPARVLLSKVYKSLIQTAISTPVYLADLIGPFVYHKLILRLALSYQFLWSQCSYYFAASLDSVTHQIL